MKVSRELYNQARMICNAYLTGEEIQEDSGSGWEEPETVSGDQMIALNSSHYQYRVKP